MKKIIGVICVISAIWVVASAAFEAAQDQGFIQTHHHDKIFSKP